MNKQKFDTFMQRRQEVNDTFLSILATVKLMYPVTESCIYDSNVSSRNKHNELVNSIQYTSWRIVTPIFAISIKFHRSNQLCNVQMSSWKFNYLNTKFKTKDLTVLEKKIFEMLASFSDKLERVEEYGNKKS